MKSTERETEKLKYKGYFNEVNSKPEGNYILIFASDWNKDYWAFYAYISQQDWWKDIRQINNLVKRMNWRDGDVYVELINFHDETMRKFYMTLYDESDWAHWNALDPETWKNTVLKQQGG
jgi:hypothetical protein